MELVHLAAGAKAPTTVTLSSSPYFLEDRHCHYAEHPNKIHIDMSFYAYYFKHTASLSVDFTGVNNQYRISLPAFVQQQSHVTWISLVADDDDVFTVPPTNFSQPRPLPPYLSYNTAFFC